MVSTRWITMLCQGGAITHSEATFPFMCDNYNEEGSSGLRNSVGIDRVADSEAPGLVATVYG